jgi:hypothetical protein
VLSFSAIILVFLWYWHTKVTDHFSITTAFILLIYVIACQAYGYLFSSLMPVISKDSGGLCFQFIVGYFIFNTLQFILSLLSPFGLVVNFIGLCCVFLLLTISSLNLFPTLFYSKSWLPDILCVMISGFAATLWCSDIQAPLRLNSGEVVFNVWQDVFIHAREISAFAQSQGINTINDIKMSGVSAPIYHFASYISAATLSALSGTSAINVYSAFLLPFGIFLTGMAAFSLVSSFWGKWPGFAATVAIVIMPDAYQQGFENKYLSYYFMSQVNLGSLYGISCAAIAWIFIILGCSNGSYKSILLGYLFLVMSLFYKAHIFVANAYLILIYPCLFFYSIKWQKRLLIGALFSCIYIFAVIFSQNFERIPIIRLDGSGAVAYIIKCAYYFNQPSWIGSFFTDIFIPQKYSKLINGVAAVILISVGTFGFWLFLMPLIGVIIRNKVSSAILCFPFLVMANYIVMALGLARNTRVVGTGEELINRPLVWAYFVVAAWTLGGAYALAYADSIPKKASIRACFILIVLLLLVITSSYTRNFQTFPRWSGFTRYEDFNSVPTCLVKSSLYIKESSTTDEIVQVSGNDEKFVFTAISERQIYAGSSTFGGVNQAHQDRLDSLHSITGIRDAEVLKSYLASTDISWYLLEPNSLVSWPKEFLDTAVFTCDGYRVFHITR